MISIIIPAYNAAQTIEKCLASIFAQTYQNFEVIVVDDGSTDDTRKILANFSRKSTVICQENRGAPAARNRGWMTVLQSSGGRSSEYVLFCDADIVLRRDCLEKMVRALEEHPEASYAYSSFRFGWKKFGLWPFDAARLRQMPYIHTTSLIRVGHLISWDESVKRLQDWDLWLTMLEHGHTGVWIPETLFQVVNAKGTMSRWLPSSMYRLPWKSLAAQKYNEAVARIKAKHDLP